MAVVTEKDAAVALPQAIVALDVGSAAEADKIVDTLAGVCDFYKVGGELFTAAGPAMVASLVDRQCRVFLDLKFHDIPNTVRSAARSAAALGVDLITVHASGGSAMVDAAVEGAGGRCRVLAVTVLTSMDAARLNEAWGRSDVSVLEEVLRLSDIARASGAAGVVCSGAEAAHLRARHGTQLDLLVPGIRLAGGEAHDQLRIVTPAAAVAAGASYLVLGRAVTGSADPRAAMMAVTSEVRAAFGGSVR